jgi:hypothetical protein
MLTLWGKTDIAVKRAIGLYFDLLCVVVLSLSPFVVHLLVNRHVFDGGFGATIQSEFAAAAWLLLALFTPVPLISLRFFCKVVMRMATPGEMLSGYSSVSKPSASYFVRVTDQLCFAFFQYVIVFIGVILVAFISGVGSVVVNLILTALCGDLVLPRAIVLVLSISVLLTAMLAGFLKPTNSKMPECGFDDMCGLTVVEIGKPPYLSENQPDV